MSNSFQNKNLLGVSDSNNNNRSRRSSAVDQIINRQGNKESLSALLNSSTANNRFTVAVSPNLSTSPTNPFLDLNNQQQQQANNDDYLDPNDINNNGTTPGLSSSPNNANFLNSFNGRGSGGYGGGIPSFGLKSASSALESSSSEENVFISIIKKSSQQNAIESICRLLETPQDLEKLDDLKNSTEKQVEKIQTQLTNLAGTQVEEADQAINLMENIRQDLNVKLNENSEGSIFHLMKILGENNGKLIDDYHVVSEVLLAHNNIKKTIEKLETLTVLRRKLRKIKAKLSHYDDQYVLSAHSDIILLEEIKDDALREVKAKVTRSDYIDIFEDYFHMIDDIRTRFEELLWLRIADLETNAENEPETVVRIARIIEKEEDRDQRKLIEYSDRLENLRRRKKNKRDHHSDDLNEDSVLEPKLRKMREEFFKRLRQSVSDKFNEAVYATEGRKSVDEKINDLTSLLGEKLNIGVTRYVSTCFPSSWQIVQFLANAYEEELVKYIEGLVNPKSASYSTLGIGDKLKVINWLDDYKNLVDEVTTNPRSFENEKKQLIGDYISTRSTFMIEYTNSTVSLDFRDFENIPLNANTRGYPYTAACVEVFTFINQQLDELMETEIPEVIPPSMGGLKASLRFFIDTSLEKVEENIEEIPLVVICALINNNTTSIDYLKAVVDRIEHLLVEDNLFDLEDQFKKNGYKMVDLLCERVIMTDVKDLLNELFTENWMVVPLEEKLDKEELIVVLRDAPVYKMVEQIFEPYYKELEEDLLEAEYRDHLTEKLAESFIGKYMERLLFNKVQFDNPLDASNQMKEDIRIVKRFFTADYTAREDDVEYSAQRMDVDMFSMNCYEPMKSIFLILKAQTPEELMKNIKKLLDSYSDISLDLLYNIIHLRGDIPKKDKQELEQDLETMYDNYLDNPNPDARISLFGKIDKTPESKKRKTKKSAAKKNEKLDKNEKLSDKQQNESSQTNRKDPKYEVPDGATSLGDLLDGEKLDFSFDEDEDYDEDE